jgi:hypothetical protein
MNKFIIIDTSVMDTRSITISQHGISASDIDVFDACHNRSSNDKNNKKREAIICAIINKIIDYPGDKWASLKKQILYFCHLISNGQKFDVVKCMAFGGLNNHFDFALDYYLNDCIVLHWDIEYKHGGKRVTTLPQFYQCSTKHNSKYAEYFYDTHVAEISEIHQIPIIPRAIYLKLVYQFKYSKHDWFSTIYGSDNSTDIDEKNKCVLRKQIVHNSIHEYITNHQGEINIDSINIKLETLHNPKKIFMINDYLHNHIHSDFMTKKELTITTVAKIKYSRSKLANGIIYNTLDPATQISALLRWKNHQGVLHPAWQYKLIRMSP